MVISEVLSAALTVLRETVDKRNAAILRAERAESVARRLEFENRVLSSEVERLRAELAAGGVLLPGWDCPACRAFNGESKGPRAECRGCGTEKRTAT